MPKSLRFHLDEQADIAIAAGLRRRGIDVTTTQEADLLSAPDQDQIDYIRSEGRVIFTHDADFLRFNALGESHPGIVYCHPQSRSLGYIIRGLVLIWELLEPAEIENCVEYL